ncbi:MAG: hypothetical protein PUK21_07745 [Peptostreptococcaceae bacterium]|nr:hypothetical protein [Peptostreptococcaceae bacterium]MDY5738564.1 hypothetical protein [Anaerovoracaceae bacterium]SFE35446.1 hypothetical protein SAMN02910327_00987 [Peptostreptococcaceae bacterium pGA-8]
MKNLIIIVGTILLGVIIVNTMVLGEGDNSLQGAAKNVIEKGVSEINSLKIGGK